jgi:anion-transporting  ArsA/GET3 family ATPase
MAPPLIVDTLLRRRVVFVSGKGGVGKSAVAAALALVASRRGRRTLLVEIDAPLEAARYLGASDHVGGVESEVLPDLWVINLDPKGVMDEFVRHMVKIDMIARRVLGSVIYERFFAAAPGLKELMMLGKIMVLEQQRERRSPEPRYDFIVVDSPATGHGLSFLKVPMAAAAAVPVGPVGHNARRVLDLLRDKERTGLVIVAIPEEMAVVEAAQFHRLAVDEVGIDALAVVLNACHERRLRPEQEAEVLRRLADGEDGPLGPQASLGAALVAARRHIRRRRLTQFYQARLKRTLPLPLATLPYLFDEALGFEGLRTLAGRLAEAASPIA